jgi:glutathione synthase/RimK-type ligase-like ATP-grasp enzyme
VAGNEKGYVYFQDFIPGNSSDTRIIVINDKAFAIRRLVRKNDFRASGSGEIEYKKELFDEQTVKLSFELAERLNCQSLALDFVYKNGKPLIVEISFGFTCEVYESCEGYWDKEMTWHSGSFNPQYWMVESLLEKAKV